MKVVILAGGLGTRISEYTKTIPKPMIKIQNLVLTSFIQQSAIKEKLLKTILKKTNNQKKILKLLKREEKQ